MTVTVTKTLECSDSVCLPNHLTDEFCQDKMCNASEPVLPKIAIKQQLDSDLEFFLVISPLLICAGLPALFMLWLLFKGLCCCTYKKVTKMCKKSKKINCSTELKWGDKTKKCGECAGSTHKVPDKIEDIF